MAEKRYLKMFVITLQLLQLDKNMPLVNITDKISGDILQKQIQTNSSVKSGNLFELGAIQTNFQSTSSFLYDENTGLKNSQQLNIDWSQFENHTFFSSAEVNVNAAIEKVITHFPFDGTKKDVEIFIDSLTGFEKYVFDTFPEFAGALHFSGTAAGEDNSNTPGTWIRVIDKSGYDVISKESNAITIINPDDADSFSIEAIINLPAIPNECQIIFQKANNKQGYTLALLPCSSSLFSTCSFSVRSGSNINSVNFQVPKGEYFHIAGVLDKSFARGHTLTGFVNFEANQSSKKQFFNKIDIDDNDAFIGSGSIFSTLDGDYTPAQTLSGTLDEFKIYHAARTKNIMRADSTRGSYASSDMKLYFRFNEPSGTISSNNPSIIIDSSGNSLHSRISNFDNQLRTNVTGVVDYPLAYEKREYKKILFPAFSGVFEMHQTFLTGAKAYDTNNPNLIFKHIPQHYLLEGSDYDGINENQIQNPSIVSDVLGESKQGSTQMIVKFLSVWAKHFDEIKIMIDAFSKMKSVSYDANSSIPDEFIGDIFRDRGFIMPTLFNKSDVNQFVYGENVYNEIDTNPIKQIKSEIARRIATNLVDITRSKGTHHSIRSFLRSVGIDPDNSLKIREYGGISTGQITNKREKKTEIIPFIHFSGSVYLTSSFLSGSRIEPGVPNIQGSYIVQNNITTGTDNASDGLWTSGSFFTELLVKLPINDQNNITTSDGSQSLVRLISSSSIDHTVVNLIASPDDDYPQVSSSLRLFVRPGFQTSSSPLFDLTLNLPGKGIYDGDIWHVAFGREFSGITGNPSSSYTLRAGKSDYDMGCITYVTTSYFSDTISVFSHISSAFNDSGLFFAIGDTNTNSSTTSYFLDNTLAVDDIARTSQFVGKAANLRFWSKFHPVDEWKSHVVDPKSLGVSNPKINYNFTTSESGSFERVRFDSLSKKDTLLSSVSGTILFYDYTLNGGTCLLTGCLTSSQYIDGEVYNYMILSPAFDEASTSDKIRIRSLYNTGSLADVDYVVETPTYQNANIFAYEEPQDDTRLSIDFSLMDSLDRDIVTMFSSLDVINDYIGRPELNYSPDYPDLDIIRNIYFQRHVNKPSFSKFLEFYRWFDISLSSFITQLIPAKTNYKGTNFVVESHMLERHKVMRYNSDNYLRSTNSTKSDSAIRLLQVVGTLKKY